MYIIMILWERRRILLIRLSLSNLQRNSMEMMHERN